MLVKICGITNSTDAKTARDAGADFVGLVFVETSKRYLEIEQAEKILVGLGGEIKPVGLFADQAILDVLDTVLCLGLKIIQLHGRESPDYLNRLMKELPACRFIKAMMITGPESIEEMQSYFRLIEDKSRILAFLLDGPSGGGMGIGFNWSEVAHLLLAAKKDLPPIFLAGGLTIDNVSDAIRILNPDGVDVSSGVETAPGRKDAEKVQKFIALAKK
ncbi:MAG: phosphoribosylanthranilate isomerase [Phycisphaerae bacterium]